MSHDLSPYAGFRDPIAESMRARMAANAMRVFNATMSRFLWDRGSGSEGEADPRTNVASECGWPINPTPELYEYLYLHDAVAARVVEFMPKQAWQVQPIVTEGGKAKGTPFLESWKKLNETIRGGEFNGYRPDKGHALFTELEHADIISGVGEYGVIYFAIDDGLDPSLPAAGIEEKGSISSDRKPDESPTTNSRQRYSLTRNARMTQGRRLVSVQSYPSTMAPVATWEINETSERYGQPILYRITELDTSTIWTGSTPPTRTRLVHWTRVIHLADITTHAWSSKVLAIPRMQVVLPEILDGRKISGADGLAFWRNANQKLFLESNPSMGGDVLFNKSETQADFENMMNGGQPWMFLRGLHANPVSPSLIDPSPHQKAKIERICIKNGWPVRIFIGSERGELASTQDEGQHKENVHRHEVNYESPRVIAPTINRLTMLGVLEMWGKDGYSLDWPEVGSQDPEKKARVFSTRMQAFAAASQQTILDEENVLKREAGFSEEDAAEILEAMEEKIAEEEEAAAQQMEEQAQLQGQPPQEEEEPNSPPAPSTANAEWYARLRRIATKE